MFTKDSEKRRLEETEKWKCIIHSLILIGCLISTTNAVDFRVNIIRLFNRKYMLDRYRFLFISAPQNKIYSTSTKESKKKSFRPQWRSTPYRPYTTYNTRFGMCRNHKQRIHDGPNCYYYERNNIATFGADFWHFYFSYKYGRRRIQFSFSFSFRVNLFVSISINVDISFRFCFVWNWKCRMAKMWARARQKPVCVYFKLAFRRQQRWNINCIEYRCVHLGMGTILCHMRWAMA